MLLNGFRDGLGLLVNFPAHRVRKPVGRGVGIGLDWIHDRLRRE
jgi:hypothetical protein